MFCTIKTFFSCLALKQGKQLDLGVCELDLAVTSCFLGLLFEATCNVILLHQFMLPPFGIECFVCDNLC